MGFSETPLSLVQFDSYVIILHRDPRSLFSSRMKILATSRKHIMMERAITKHCRMYLQNYQITHENNRPDQECIKSKIMNIKFEDVVLDPLYWAREIYRFTRMSIPDFYKSWAEMHTLFDRERVIEKYKSELSKLQIERINYLCKDYMEALEYI